jgi:1,4-alpha-glucan branching enzyme
MAADPASRPIIAFQSVDRRGEAAVTSGKSSARASRNALEVLLSGLQKDPFSVLGPHQVDGRTIIRAFLPGAISVEAVARDDGQALGSLETIHPGGLFAGEIPGRAYCYRIQWPGGSEEVEDPYCFPPLLGELDLHLISEGTHYELGRCLGAQTMVIDGIAGVRFAVWAPNARRVSVVGEFNAWDGRRHPMRPRLEAGVWELFVPRVTEGCLYKFEIVGPDGSLLPQKADPVARASEKAPATASIVVKSESFEWTDEVWLNERQRRQSLDAAISIYEVHPGSWLRITDEGDRPLTWREMAERLTPYVKDMGFTHIEFTPITEYPFGGSWGYQPLGMFAPTGRYGPAEDFAYLVDQCHACGIGVVVDWVPAHFPSDVWGLARFDGTALYEHQDPREGYHQDWNTLIYNLGRNEVKGFLIASALEWIERYHVDALRVDAVASMLYRDYSRKAGEWIPNRYGGRENLEAIEFLKHFNSIIAERSPGVLTIAEESTAWPGVTKSVERGGLGFSLKWNMGWMHDTLHYMEKDPIFRIFEHHNMTFAMVYAYSERFVLPLSHDEVVHGKGSLILKMPGDDWQRFANLRAYLGWMWAFPGKKLLFMGDEFAQWAEWNHDASLDWNLLDDRRNKGVQLLVADLNRLYTREPALFATDMDPSRFRWVVVDDRENSVFAFVRSAPDGSIILTVSNFTPVPRLNYTLSVESDGLWQELLNTDAAVYGGSNVGNGGLVFARRNSSTSNNSLLTLVLPPLSTLMLRNARQ